MRIRDMLYVLMQRPMLFTIGVTSGLTTTGTCFYHISEKMVRLDLFIQGTITTSTVLGTIGERFRPSVARSVGALIVTTSNVMLPISVTINPDGTIKQNSSNSVKTIMIHGLYYQ